MHRLVAALRWMLIQHLACADLVDGAMERAEEPGKPLGDIHRPFLRALQDVVAGLTLTLDLR